jgi:hypothetical protein
MVGSADRLTGYIASMSIAGIPTVSKAPPSIVPKLWRSIYAIGVTSAPKIALVSSTAFAYAAYSLSKTPAALSNSPLNPIYLLSTAAVSTVLIVPWTLLTMLPTNNALHAKLAAADAQTDAKEDSELLELLKKWAGLNGVRSVFPLVGAITGLWAITS